MSVSAVFLLLIVVAMGCLALGLYLAAIEWRSASREKGLKSEPSFDLELQIVENPF